MPDAFEQTMNVPLIAVAELPFRYLVMPDVINGQPAAHLLLSLPNVTCRVTFDTTTGLEVARELKDALLGTPQPKGGGPGLTVVESDGLIAPGDPGWNGGPKP